MANKNLRKLIKMGILPESKKAWDAQVKKMKPEDLEDFDIRVGSLEETDPGLYDELLSYITMEDGSAGLRQLGEDFYGAEPVQKTGIRGKQNTSPETIEANVPETTKADQNLLEDAPAGNADDEYLVNAGFDPASLDPETRAATIESLRQQDAAKTAKGEARKAKKADGRVGVVGRGQQAGAAKESDAKQAARAMLERSAPQTPESDIVATPTDMNFTDTVGDMSYPMFSPEGMPGVVMADMADMPQMPPTSPGISDDIDAIASLDYRAPPNEPPPPPMMPFDENNMSRVTAQGPFVSGGGMPMLDEMGTYGMFGDQPSALAGLASGIEDTGMPPPMRGPGFSNAQQIATPGDMLTQMDGNQMVGGTLPENPPPPGKPPKWSPVTSRAPQFMRRMGSDIFTGVADHIARNAIPYGIGIPAAIGAGYGMFGERQPQITPDQMNEMDAREQAARQRAAAAAASMRDMPLGQ